MNLATDQNLMELKNDFSLFSADFISFVIIKRCWVLLGCTRNSIELVNLNISNLNKINKNGQIRSLLTYVQVYENQSSKAGVVGDTHILKVVSSEVDSGPKLGSFAR
jgi:hypothetical protein